MSNLKKGDIPRFTGKKKQYYQSLLQSRDIVLGQMQFHRDEALDCSNSDKKGVTTHMADMGSDNSRHEMELHLLTEEGNVLELIEDALQRLGTDEFGKCQDCGEDISEARLEVKPYANYCIKCTTVREKNGGINPNLE